MKHVLARVEALTEVFSGLEYFAMLERTGFRSDVDIMGRGLAFFVMSFQDMLRLNAQRMTDPRLALLAKSQRMDDAGHELWFLQDLRKLGIEPDVRWLFGSEHRRTRDTSYEIIAEILTTPSDYARLAVGLALEATGGVYFSRVFKFFAGLGLDDGFAFFSKSHWDVEQAHDVFGSESQAELQSLALPREGREQALAATEHTFQAMTRMCEDLSSRMLEARAKLGFDAAPASLVRLNESSGVRP